jgi:starch synthase
MLNVAMCSSEAVPFAKTGGLADVAGTLPVPLKKLGVNTIVVMPGYNFIFSKFSGIKKVMDNLEV